MNIDYEKAYKEAIERIKTRFDKWALDDEDMKAIQTLIPELKESEDERVRKILIEQMERWKKAAEEEGVEQDVNDATSAIAYLERQKPVYNLEIPAGDVAPAEEDGPFDEDEFLEGELSAFFQNYDKEYDDDAAVSDVAKHFYEIGKKQKEQKPAEWSEEDEWKRNELLKYLEEKGDYRSTWYSWLKSLRPQPKVELTLLDDNIISAAVAFVEQNDHFNYWGGIDKHTIIKALHSLKPHWKPSEEQMRAVFDASERNDKLGSVLLTLYHDLKKL